MYKLSYVVRVSANNLDELKRRCNESERFLWRFKRKTGTTIWGYARLTWRILPASLSVIWMIIFNTWPLISSLNGFWCYSNAGENEGIYVGFSLDTGHPMSIWNYSYSSQGVKGSSSNAISVGFVGSLGGNPLRTNIVYAIALWGWQWL